MDLAWAAAGKPGSFPAVSRNGEAVDGPEIPDAENLGHDKLPFLPVRPDLISVKEMDDKVAELMRDDLVNECLTVRRRQLGVYPDHKISASGEADELTSCPAPQIEADVRNIRGAIVLRQRALRAGIEISLYRELRDDIECPVIQRL